MSSHFKKGMATFLLYVILFSTLQPYPALAANDNGCGPAVTGEAGDGDDDDLFKSVTEAGRGRDSFTPTTADSIAPTAQRNFETRFKDEVMEYVLSEAGVRQNARFIEGVHYNDPTRYEIWTAAGSAGFIRKKSVQSTVRIILSTNVDPFALGRDTAAIERTGPKRLEAMVGIHPSWITPENFDANRRKLRGLFRSAFIGDKAIHPTIVKDERTGKKTPSYEQAETLEALGQLLRDSSLDDIANPEGLPVRMPRIGLSAPGGFGKTFSEARFFSRHATMTLPDGSARLFVPDAVIFCVHSVNILDGSIKSFANEFDWTMSQVQRVHSGDEKIDGTKKGSKLALDPNSKLLLVTRSGLHTRWDDVVAWTRGKKVAWFFDEAHYLISKYGENGGAGHAPPPDAEQAAEAERLRGDSFQFAEIIEKLNRIPVNPNDPEHLAGIASATLYRSDEAPIITDPEILGYRSGPRKGRGKVTGPYFQENPQGLADLEAENNVPDVNSGQMRESMLMGYAAPTRVVANISVEDEDGNEDGKAIDRNSKDEAGTTSQHISRPEIRRLWEMIKEERVRYQPDRGLVVVRGIVRTNEVAKLLNEMCEEDATATGEPCDAEAQSLNSQNSDGDQLKWIRDDGALSSDKHKYLIVDGMVNEGVDIPGLNLVVIHKSMKDSIGGRRKVAQILMRGSRVAPFCTETRVIDYSGRAREVLAGVGQQKKVKVQRRRKAGPAGPGPIAVVDEVDVVIDETLVPYIPAQTMAVTTSVEHLELLMLANNTFADVEVRKGGGRGIPATSRLAHQLLRLVHLLPGVHVGGKWKFDTKSLSRIESERGRQLAQAVGPRILELYNDMLYAAGELAKIDSRGVLAGPEKQARDEYAGMLPQLWTEMLDEVMKEDPFRDHQTTLKVTGKPTDSHSVEIIASLYRQIFDELFRLGGGKTLKVKSVSGLTNGIQFTIEGPMAYGMLRAESGKHKTTTVDKSPYTRHMTVKVKSGHPDDDVFDGTIDPNTLRRYIDSRNRSIRDHVSNLNTSMKTPPTESSADTELNPSQLSKLLQMFRWNYHDFAASLIEESMVAELLPDGK